LGRWIFILVWTWNRSQYHKNKGFPLLHDKRSTISFYQNNKKI